ncbi:MAG TPA: hypothetical protein VH349_05425 [Ktedonobacterales bacterium]|jgi:hypothetical protein
MTTFIPDTPDTLTATMNGKVETTVMETPPVVEFGDTIKERMPLLDRLSQRWGLIAGLIGASVAVATTATVVADLIARRREATSRVFGFRPVRRYGARLMKTPRGGSAWVVYLYRTPDLGMRLPIHK